MLEATSAGSIPYLIVKMQGSISCSSDLGVGTFGSLGVQEMNLSVMVALIVYYSA